MHVTFYGGVREVTGSMHLITTENDRILLDCGMFQGRLRDCGTAGLRDAGLRDGIAGRSLIY